MDTSISVSPGDAWRPESAGRFNRVSDMLNTIGVIGPAGQCFPAEASAVIIRRNAGDTTIPAASCVTFDGVDMRPGIEDPCGVTLAECAPGAEGPVQVSGIAEVAYTFPLPSDVLVLKGGSRNDPTSVLLNSTGHNTHRNYFRVTATGWDDNGYITGISVTDGGNPESIYCGVTDVGDVPAGTLSGTFYEGYICLRLVVDDSGNTPAYSHQIEYSSSVPSPRDPVVILAEIVPRFGRRAVVQRWTGGMIHWRDRFVIGFGRGN